MNLDNYLTLCNSTIPLQLLHIKPNQKVLDLGCGNGRDVRSLLNKGVDVDTNPKKEEPEDASDVQSIVDYMGEKQAGIKRLNGDDFKNATSDELKAWLMTETNDANKWAMDKVFKNATQKPKDKPERKILPTYPQLR